MKLFCKVLAGMMAVGMWTGKAEGADSPLIDSWFTANSGRYARLYRTYADEQAGAAQTTWDNGTYAQSLPVYGGVQKIQHSDNYVYVTTTGLAAGHVMGPWYNDTGPGGSLEVFQNWPEAIYTIYRLPVVPVIPVTKTTYGGGAIGLMIDGTLIFSESDTYSWDNNGDGTGNGVDRSPGGSGGNGDGLWLHDAFLSEGNTFDKSNAHAAGNQLHYHASPMKLRHVLGDSVAATQQPDGSYLYTESFNGKHSPLLGWMNDGIPLYGPYGYSSALDANSGVRRMVSGFIVRNGANGSYNTAANGRTTLPAWSARYRGRSTACTINEQGPTAAAVAVPYFMEDYDYLGDLTNPTDSQPYEQGVDFDLNEYNVRFCVTPEFPEGTWAYFVSIGADGQPAFPYNVGAQYYGNPSNGGAVTSISEAVTTDWVGGPDAEIKMDIVGDEEGVLTISWSAVEGGTYTLESTSDIASGSWPSGNAGLTPTLDRGQFEDEVGGSASYYRAVRTALASYDTTGSTAGMGGGTGGGGTGGAPTISQVSPNTGTEGGNVTVSITLSGDMLPPSGAIPTVTLGSFNGTAVSYNGTTVTASFTLTTGTTGAKNVTVTFPAPPDGEALVITSTGGFTINAMGGGGGGGGVVTFNATFATTPPLPPQNAIEVAAVGGVTATITSYNQGTGAVTLQFNNSALATGNHTATLKFTPPSMSQQTLTSSNQYTKN